MSKLDTNQIKVFILDYLKKLGFAENESIIYFTLLESGQMTILELSRKSGIERTKIYGTTEKLVKIGILEEVIDFKRKFLKPCPISKLEILVEEQKRKLNYLSKSFGEFSSYLKYFQNNYNPTKVQFYRGKDGIKQVLWNELGTKSKKIYSFTYRHIGEIVGMKFAKKMSAEYKARKILCWDIQSREFARSLNSKLYPRVFDIYSRYIDPKTLDINIVFEVYDDVVAIFNWHVGEIFAVEIYNQKFADFIRQIHKVIWKMGSKELVR